jgi:hypothetical protein
MTYVDLWGWFHQQRQQFARTQDFQRLRLVTLYERMWTLREKDPQLAYQLCQEGITLARTLNEPCWEIFHENWAYEVLRYYVGDIEAAMKASVGLIAKLSQPRFQGCPINARAYFTLVSAYFGYDALGYQHEIEDLLAYMQQHIALDQDTFLRMEYFRAAMAYELEDYALAEQRVQHYLDLSQHSVFRQRGGYNLLMHIWLERRDFSQALDYAEQYLQTSRLESIEGSIARALMWVAALEQKLERPEAAQHFRQALMKMEHIHEDKGQGYYDALSSYALLIGNEALALAAWDEFLETTKAKTIPLYLADGLLRRYTVLRYTGDITQNHVDRLYEVAKSLKSVEQFNRQILRVLSGETPRGMIPVPPRSPSTTR